MAQQVQFVYLTQAEYDALGTKDAARLYFTSDTGRIYRGTVTYAPQRVFYGTCNTGASTAAKAVTCAQFTSSDFVAGTTLKVKFTYSNTNTAPSITIGGSNKRIYRYGTTNPVSYMWYPNQMVEFVYDGTYWLMVNPGPATTTYEGVVKLNDTLTSTSTTEAATANAVKQLNDKFDDYVLLSDLQDGFNVNSIEANSITIDGKAPSLEGHTHSEYKVLQTAKSSPSASGTDISFIDTISQDTNGEITATRKSVRSATTSQTGVVQLSSATNSTSEALAATPKAVKTAYDLASSKSSVTIVDWEED